MPKNPEIYLRHILECIEMVYSYIEGISEKEFLQDVKLQDAVIRRIEIVGEAANKLPEEFRNDHAGIEWSVVIGMRNILIHDYAEIKLSIVWQTVKRDLPDLEKKIRELVE